MGYSDKLIMIGFEFGIIFFLSREVVGIFFAHKYYVFSILPVASVISYFDFKEIWNQRYLYFTDLLTPFT